MLHARLSKVSTSPTVLIVEDDADMRDLLADTLRRDGYITLTASSVREAASVLGPDDPRLPPRRVDLVLSDVRMDGQTGIDLGRLLRTTRPTTPLILMTAFPEPALVVEASALGATVLPKPFRLDVLRRTVLTTIAVYIRTLSADDRVAT